MALPNGILHHELHEVITGATVIAILLVWSRLPAKIRMIPAPLVAIVAATALAIAAGLDTDRISLSGNFFDALNLPHISGATPNGKPWLDETEDIVIGVLTIALIASVESLLCAVGVDKLHNGPRTNFDKEIIGQGSANVVSGLLGGLPITGVIVRSSANAAAGARTRMSAVLHGVWILLFASLFTDLVELIPKAALAGLLIVVGAQLIKLAHIKLAWRTGNFAVYAITILSVVFLNLLEGVLIGLAVAIGFLLVRVTRAPVAVQPVGGEQSKQWRIDIDGTLSFLLLPRLTKALASVPQGTEVTLNLNADYIDDSVSETIEDWQRTHEARGGVVVIVETTGPKLQNAHARPPKRHFASPPIGLVPWRSANHENNGEASILDRVDEYHRNGSAVLHQHIAGLGGAQDPYALFLTCADSRILPNVITASGPGDLYTVRNFGNLVPADSDDRSVDAAIEFAASQLGVRSVVICGHSSCAAMKVLLDDNAGHSATPMAQWLQYAGDSLAAYRDHHPARASAAANGYSEIDQLSIVNVAIQLERLIRHPILATPVTVGDIQVVGIFFDIATSRVYEVTPRGIVCPEEPPLHAWQTNNLQEELIDLPYRTDELVEVDWLCDIGVGMQLVAAQDVFLRRGSGEHHDRDTREIRVGLHLLQQLAAVVLGQIQIQQDEVRSRRALEPTALVEKVEPFFTVVRDVQSILKLVVLQCLPRNEFVSRVVFDEQDLDCSAGGCHWRVPSSAAGRCTSTTAGSVNSNRVPSV